MPSRLWLPSLLLGTAVVILCLLAILQPSSATISDHTAPCPVIDYGDNVYQQLNGPGTSIGTLIIFLGKFNSSFDCAKACEENSSNSDPCRSWTYFHSNFTGDGEAKDKSAMASNCFGRHDNYWDPNFVFNAALTSGVNCDHPPSTFIDSPGAPLVIFSWDKVPVFFHSANYSGPYNDDAISLMARFPIVTIEKYQGPDSGYNYPKMSYKCCEEDRIVNTLRRVKAVNPNVSGVFYYNMLLDFPQYRLHNLFVENESWWLHDRNGRVLHLRGSGHLQADLLAYDVTIDTFAQLFAETCLNLTKTGAVDGCFVDRFTDGLDQKYLSPVQNVQLRLAHLQLLQMIQQKLKAGPNGPLIANHAYSTPGVNGLQRESFDATEENIARLQWVGQWGKLVEAHVPLTTNCSSEQELENYLAAFLIGAERYAYFGCGQWYTNLTAIDESHWHTLYDKPLGAPLAKAVKTGSTYSRKFQSGTEVTFNVQTNKGTIRWAEYTNTSKPQ